MVQVFVGIGSSVNRAESINAGIASLDAEFGSLTCSVIYESEAVGFVGRNFYNLVVSFESELPVKQLISTFKRIELQNGRDKSLAKFAPKTLDIDLLLYGDLVEHGLNLPRAEILENAFVLKPLADLVPQMKHPVLQQKYQELWDKYPKDKQKLWKASSQF